MAAGVSGFVFEKIGENSFRLDYLFDFKGFLLTLGRKLGTVRQHCFHNVFQGFAAAP